MTKCLSREERENVAEQLQLWAERVRTAENIKMSADLQAQRPLVQNAEGAFVAGMRTFSCRIRIDYPPQVVKEP